MKHIETLTWIPIIVLVLACSSKNSTEPDENGGSVIASQKIGPEGGSIGTSDFTLSIPENAFSEIMQLEVTVNTEGQPFEECKASDVYTIAGLPLFFDQALTVTIKQDSNLTGFTFLAVGQPYQFSDSSETFTGYAYYDGQDSSGYFVAEIPASPQNLLKMAALPKAQDQEQNPYQISLATNFSDIRFKPYVYCKSPASLKSQVEDILEAALNRIQTLDASLPAENDFIMIDLQPSMSYGGLQVIEYSRTDHDILDESGKIIRSYSNASLIWMDASLLYPQDYIPQLGRCLFQYMIQRKLAIPPLGLVKLFEVPDNRNYWLHSAIATWSEIYFSDQPKYIPSQFFSSKYAPFHYAGLAFQEQNFYDHVYFGYGMSALIKYLVQNHPDGVKMILNFYHQLEQSKPVCHLTALIDQQNKPVNEWWPDFIESYLTGRVFDFIIPNLIEPEPVDWVVDDKDDIEWSHVDDYPDICSDLFRLSFDFNSLSEKAKLNLSISGAHIASDLYELAVFDYDGNRLNYMGKADVRDLVIGNIKGLCTDQRDLVIALTKSAYQTPNLDGHEQIDVQARIDSTTWCTPVCQLDCYLWSNVHWESKLENGPPPEDIDFYVGVWAEADEATSSWEGMQFSATWDYDYELSPEIHYHGNMMIEYDPENNAIAYFQCNQQMTQQTADGLETSTWSIAGENLPHTPHNTDDYILYSVEGSAAHQVVTHLMYTFDGVDTYQSLNSGPLQNSENRIEIKFLTQ
jgi:hypothetical protein